MTCRKGGHRLLVATLLALTLLPQPTWPSQVLPGGLQDTSFSIKGDSGVLPTHSEPPPAKPKTSISHLSAARLSKNSPNDEGKQLEPSHSNRPTVFSPDGQHAESPNREPKQTPRSKRYTLPVAEQLQKKLQPSLNKRYIDSIAGHLLKRSGVQFHTGKRYIDSIAGHLLKKSYTSYNNLHSKSVPDDVSELQMQQNKRYIDSIAGDLLKRTRSVISAKADSHRLESESTDDYIGNDGQPPATLSLGRNHGGRQYVDSINEELLTRLYPSQKRVVFEVSTDPQTLPAVWDGREIRSVTGFNQNSSHSPEKRYLDSISGDMLKRSDKRYTDSIAGDLLKRSNKRYIDSIAGDLLKRSNKRYLDSIAGDLLKRSEKRYIDSIAGYLLKRSDKRYIDSIAGDLLKRSDKRYIDSIAGYLLKRSNKRYIDSIAGDLLKRSDKRYIDSIAGYLLKRSDKRYIDSIAGDLLKRSARQADQTISGGNNSDTIHKTTGIPCQDVSCGGVEAGVNHGLTHLPIAFGPEDSSSTFSGREAVKSHKQQGKVGSTASSQQHPPMPQVPHMPLHRQKRFIDSIASHLLKRNLQAYQNDQVLPPSNYVGSSSYVRGEISDHVREQDPVYGRFYPGESPPRWPWNTGYTDSLSSYLVKRPPDNTFGDPTSADVPARSDFLQNIFHEKSVNKRYVDSISGDLLKRRANKRYIDSITAELLKRSTDKRYIDSISGDLLKRQANGRYMATSDGERRHADKKRYTYVDSISGDLLKRSRDKQLRALLAANIIKALNDTHNINDITKDVLQPPVSKRSYYFRVRNLWKRYWGYYPYLDSISGDLLKRADIDAHQN